MTEAEEAREQEEARRSAREKKKAAERARKERRRAQADARALALEEARAFAGWHAQGIGAARARRGDGLAQFGVEVAQGGILDPEDFGGGLQVDVGPLLGQGDHFVGEGWLFLYGVEAEELWVFGHDRRRHK